MSNIFRLAIKYLNTGQKDTGPDGICAALSIAQSDAEVSVNEYHKAKAFVSRSLEGYAYVSGWLCEHQPGFREAWEEAWTKNWDRAKYRASPLWKEVQDYRVRWLEYLADEFDAGRIKL